MQEETPILRVENVSKRYGKREVLRGVSLSIRKGDLKILIGPYGAGKSTLLQCIKFLVKPDEGRVWLEGEEVKHSHKKDLYAYRQKVGMIFQDFNLFDHLSAMENVMIGLVKVKGMSREAAQARAQLELERVGLREHTAKYPAQLSGGQKQRVSIARALAMDPKVMLLDEPTSALDPELEQEVVRVIKALADEGRTMLLVTHDMKLAADCSDHVIFLHQGKIEEEGPPDQLFGNPQTERLRGFLSATGA